MKKKYYDDDFSKLNEISDMELAPIKRRSH